MNNNNVNKSQTAGGQIVKSPPVRPVHNLKDLLESLNDTGALFANVALTAKTQDSRIQLDKARHDIFKTVIKAGIIPKDEGELLLGEGLKNGDEEKTIEDGTECDKPVEPASARIEANRLSTIFKTNQAFEAYRCPKCFWCHVTSNSYSPPRNEHAARRAAAKIGSMGRKICPPQD